MWEDTGIFRNKFLWGREKGLIVARRKPQRILLSGECVTYNYHYQNPDRHVLQCYVLLHAFRYTQTSWSMKLISIHTNILIAEINVGNKHIVVWIPLKIVTCDHFVDILFYLCRCTVAEI